MPTIGPSPDRHGIDQQDARGSGDMNKTKTTPTRHNGPVKHLINTGSSRPTTVTEKIHLKISPRKIALVARDNLDIKRQNRDDAKWQFSAHLSTILVACSREGCDNPRWLPTSVALYPRQPQWTVLTKRISTVRSTTGQPSYPHHRWKLQRWVIGACSFSQPVPPLRTFEKRSPAGRVLAAERARGKATFVVAV